MINRSNFVQIYTIENQYYNFRRSNGKLLYDIYNAIQKFHCQTYQIEQILEFEYFYRRYWK